MSCLPICKTYILHSGNAELKSVGYSYLSICKTYRLHSGNAELKSVGYSDHGKISVGSENTVNKRKGIV
jgi:hypothetical protein